ncbi:MAG: protein phosphatase 2C domain-containing protein [Chitinophagaceae bacterium]
MNIYTALQIGDYHLNYCEDYLFTGNIGKDKMLCAVMDGCTMGTDSYFAATMVGKLLRKIVKEKDYKEFYGVEFSDQTIDEYLKSILSELFRELIMVKGQLALERNELLTTLIILLVDKSRDEGTVLVVGDGMVCIDGVITEFEQDNKPDYLGFHLGEDFEEWYSQQHQKKHFRHFADISIATDGISSFKSISGKPSTIEHPAEYLVCDSQFSQGDDMLYRKLKTLEHTSGLKPTDDLAIVRIVK